MKWHNKREIVSYFFGSYDTTFHKSERSVTRNECTRMVATKKCVQLRSSSTEIEGVAQPMRQSGTTWLYNEVPKGEGVYFHTAVYTEVNCMIETVTMKQDCPNCAIYSSMGKVTDDPKALAAAHGAAMIIWEPISVNSTKPCELNKIHNGTARITTTLLAGAARVIDDAKQLELTISNKTMYCDKMATLYSVADIKGLYVTLDRKDLKDPTSNAINRISEANSVLQSGAAPKLKYEIVNTEKFKMKPPSAPVVGRNKRSENETVTPVDISNNKTTNMNETLSNVNLDKSPNQCNMKDMCSFMGVCDLIQQNCEPKDQPRTPRIDDTLYVKHHLYMEQRALDRENLLAKEIHDVYCKVSELKKYQTTLLAHSSGILAAKALNMGTCTRIHAHGETFLLQQCTTVKTVFDARETKCGWEPFTNNKTIAKDGYTLIPFQPCYWQGGLANFNGKLYSYKDQQWIVRNPNIRVKTLELIDHFNIIEDLEMEYLLNMHAAHRNPPMDTMNIVGELVAHMADASSDTVQPLLVKQDFLSFSDWLGQGFYYLKMAVVTFLVVFVLVPLLIKLVIACIQSRRAINAIHVATTEVEETAIAMQEPLPTASAPLLEDENEIRVCPNIHSKISYSVTYGMVWEDGCPVQKHPQPPPRG